MDLKTVTAFLAVSLAAACTLAPLEMRWNAQREVDKFADTETCRVTTWLSRDDQPRWRFANHIYPVVERRGNTVLVGVMTAPMRNGPDIAAFPAGDVQIRIDGNPAWSIASVETPADVSQGTSTQLMSQSVVAQTEAMLKSNPHVDTTAMAEAQRNMMTQMSSVMSPRTLATGEKAAQILAQMKAGRTIMYRKITTGTVTSEPVSFNLDGFNAALAKCGL